MNIISEKEIATRVLDGIETILNLSEEEKEMESLWKVFYKTIGIDARRNDRCRRNFMPKKYWKYILEVEDEL